MKKHHRQSAHEAIAQRKIDFSQLSAIIDLIENLTNRFLQLAETQMVLREKPLKGGLQTKRLKLHGTTTIYSKSLVRDFLLAIALGLAGLLGTALKIVLGGDNYLSR